MKKPFTEKLIMRILTIVVVVLALYAGYYYTQLKSVKKQYQKLESRYQTEKESWNAF